MNIKDAKEVREKVEEIKRKRNTKCTKNSKKGAKSEKKFQKDKKKVQKFRKFIVKFIVFEYLIFGLVISICNQIMINRENEKKTNIIAIQQETILKLSKTYENCLQPILNTEEIKITHRQLKSKEIEISESDRELIAKLLYHEGRGESLECQKAIVSVILNRVEAGHWGNTISQVICARNQFEPVAKGLLDGTKPLAKQYEAIDYVLENGVTVPEDVIYFRAGHYFSWAENYCRIDNTFFSK